jgi:taurine dioxygenase
MKLCPLTPILGVEISGVELDSCSTQYAKEVLRPLLIEHKLLVFRGQGQMMPEAHIRIAGAMGTLEYFAGALPDHPELVRITHGPGSPPSENIWHSDMSFREEPPMGAVLRAVSVPTSGGDTVFADMRYALGRLPSAVRRFIENLDASHNVAKCAPDNARAELVSALPPVVHPVVRLHPETQEELLYVNSAYTTHILGLDESDGSALLNLLLGQVLVPECQCRVRWTDGTMVIWDNRALQHYAVGDYMPATRIMERASLAGDRPARMHSVLVSASGRSPCESGSRR